MNNNQQKIFNEVIAGANQILKQKDDFLILDTETTGLGKNDVVIQMGIIDLDGNVIYDQLIKPSRFKRIPAEAVEIHRISYKMLEEKPFFKDIKDEFYRIINGKQILIYNSEFDLRLLKQTCKADEVEFKNIETFCVVKAYSMFVGEWDERFNEYKYQKLEGGDHSAIGDCRATLNILKKMANTKPYKKSFWEKLF